jgi:hypothetical protein
MDDQSITCPNCKAEIRLTDALIGPIQEKLRSEYEACLMEREEAVQRKEKDLERSLEEMDASLKKSFEQQKEKIRLEAEKAAKDKLGLEMKDLEEKLKERDCQLKEIEEQELLARKKLRELEEREKNLDKQVELKLQGERERIMKDAAVRTREEVDMELKDLRSRLVEKEEILKKSREEELQLRKKQRELEEKEKEMELEVQRKMDKDRRDLESALRERLQEEHHLKELEKEKTIADLKEQIDIMKIKAEQGSQQLQGEVLELSLEDDLARRFPFDEIREVKKGQRGADVLQTVRTNTGFSCGTIIWETKRAKNWSNEWISKLKEDQREKSADLAVLCSTVLPKDVSNFDVVNGVVVTNTPLALPIASFLRNQLLDTARLKRSSQGRNDKKEMLYSYLTGTEFRQSVEGIAEAFLDMKNELEREKTHAMKSWKKREKQMERALNNLIGMYGSMQGIAGASIPEIKTLEVERIPEKAKNGNGGTLEDF